MGQNTKLQELINKQIPYFDKSVKSSANFFNNNSGNKNTETKISFEFDQDKSLTNGDLISAGVSSLNKNIRNTASGISQHPAVEKVKEPIKKHGIKFYSFLIIFLALVIVFFTIIANYSTRYQQINKGLEQCYKSIESLKNEKIETKNTNCPDYFKPIWTSEYWKNGLLSDSIINEYNTTIGKNEDLFKKYQSEWLKISQSIQSEFKTYKSSSNQALVIDQYLPSDSLKLGEKLENGIFQLSKLEENNLTVSTDIKQLTKDLENNITLYQNKVNLTKYIEYLNSFNSKTEGEKTSSYQDLKKTYAEFSIFIEQEIAKLKVVNKEDIIKTELKQFKTFTPDELYNLYENYDYAFVNDVVKEINLTSVEEVDNYIEKKAQERGYKKRNIAQETRLESVDGQLLQPEARESFQRMKLAAAKDGINLVLVSGFRSPAAQKRIFSNLFSDLYSGEQILSGSTDVALDKVLSTSSIPTYSKHHTGYTIDLGCASRELTTFKNTTCFRWLSENNYLNAKKFGYIPSYPSGVSYKQGPNPEEWEYVWIGTELLKNIEITN